MTEVLLLSLFHRWLGADQAADYIPPVLIASSLIDDGRLRTPSNCSAHRFMIASLLVRRLVPSALRSGVAPELWGPYIVEFIKELLHILSVCKRQDIISLFAQPGVLHVFEPRLNCLAYV